MPKEQRKAQLNKFLNLPHIQPLVETFANPNSDKSKHGRNIRYTIMWNPNNVYSGPLPQNRWKGDDKGSEVDIGIKNALSDQFKEAIDTFEEKPSLDNFGAIPAGDRLTFEPYPGSKSKMKVIPSKKTN